MDLAIAPCNPDRLSDGIAIYDKDSPGHPLLVISEMDHIVNLNRQLFAWIEWSRVAKSIPDIEEDQMPKSYGGTK
tara:strand:+ start:3231 stop:3455 length:225 start_codon:yes stop_codon:yes gene_type:complete